MRILIIDDDEMVRSVCCGMLRLMQHEPTASGGGAEALKILQETSPPFDLILLDEMMPEVSGRETFQRLRDLGFTMPVIICSGRNVVTAEFADARGQCPHAILNKPFTMAQLQAVLNQCLQ